ncbi:LysR family transcriptional regulator [Nocardioides albus]|uniref:DNA-binding transcriptional LysR family regulator n=1 Tax=Nocardioides albus TaxID=1841 RepID=A0A7W5FA28_9ACTN|nr:LysR family transcriptional regulator [Nocardioides albus]MBB3090848.1 DNA-binding transcriptional LysR family regulator [Nocardioides albus]GGU37891.1 LysR family transcriptional regulator [Nocardioides albus]
MELRALKSFVTIADCGSVSRAAELLHTTQPALSRQLQRFEAEVGSSLFDRMGRGLALTAAGRRLLPVARDLATRADLAQETVVALRAGAPGAVMVSAPHTTATDIVAPFLASWGPEDPLPMVWETPSLDTYEALDRGADLAIGAGVPPRRLRRLVLADLPVWAYVRPDHRWASRGSVDLGELEDEQLLVLESGQHSRTALERALAGQELPLGKIVEFENAEVAQAVASAGRGVAVVSDDPRYGLVPLRIIAAAGPLCIRLYAAWSDQHYASEVLAGLALRLRAFSRERYGIAEPT